MSALKSFLCFVLIFGITGMPFSYTNAKDLENLDDLKDLVNEPSRTQLFELEVAAAKAEAAPAEKKSIEQFALKYGVFKFPYDARKDVVADPPKDRVDSIFGIDLSHHTPDVFPFETLSLKSINYVYLKASQGTGFKDGKFAAYWARLDKVPVAQRVHRGAYHFLSHDSDGKAQAQTFLRVLEANGGLKPTDMPPVLDLEWDKASKNSPDRWSGKSPQQILASAKAWLEEVEKQTGRKPMLYTTRSWWRERMGSESSITELAGYSIWIADYSKSSRAVEVPKIPAQAKWALWQFTDSAQLTSGYANGFDANIFKGSRKQFYETFDLVPFQP